MVNEIVNDLGLKNVRAEQIRAEKMMVIRLYCEQGRDQAAGIHNWVKRRIRKKNFNSLNNGILYLKGGEVEEELNGLQCRYAVYDLDINFPIRIFPHQKADIHTAFR